MSRAFWCRQAGEKLSSAEKEFIEFEIQQKMVKIAFPPFLSPATTLYQIILSKGEGSVQLTSSLR